MRRKTLMFALAFMIGAGVCHAEGIALPGCERLIFTAGQSRQGVDFHNPASNSCYFRLTLVLESGKVLWRSDFIEPGVEVKEILLAAHLEAGTYNAVLSHECFSLKDKTPLNGLNVKLKILSEVNGK